MKNIIFTLFFCFGFSLLYAQENVLDSVSINIQQAWERSDAFSKEIKQANIQQQIGNTNTLDAKRKWAPTIEAEARFGKLTNIPIFVDGLSEDPEYIPLANHNSYGAGVHANFNIYDGGKVKNAVKKAENRALLLQYVSQATYSQVHYKVAEYYLDILRSKEFVKIIEKNITRNNERLEQVSELYEHGVVLKSDLLRAQLQLSQQKINLHSMKNNIEIASQKLNMLLGFEDDQPLKLSDSIGFNLSELDEKYTDYVVLAMQQSPLNKMAESEIELSELQEKDVHAEKLPKISLFGEYSYSYPQNRWYPYAPAGYMLGMAGVRMSYNISSLYLNKHKASAAKLDIQQQIVAKENTKEVLRSRIKTAYKRFLEDKENIEVGLINIEQAQENYRIVNQTYFNQLALLTDLLEADAQLLQAQFDLVNNYVSARLHYYQLLKITGQL